MRIYAKFIELEDIYHPIAPSELSLLPIDGENVRYLDLEDGEIYKSLSDEFEELDDYWKVWNGEVCLGTFPYNPKTKEYINSEIVGGHSKNGQWMIDLKNGEAIKSGDYEEDWYMYQSYQYGKPAGEPYFKTFE